MIFNYPGIRGYLFHLFKLTFVSLRSFSYTSFWHFLLTLFLRILWLLLLLYSYYCFFFVCFFLLHAKKWQAALHQAQFFPLYHLSFVELKYSWFSLLNVNYLKRRFLNIVINLFFLIIIKSRSFFYLLKFCRFTSLIYIPVG